MINEKKVKRYCSEDLRWIENYDKAISDVAQTWDCHHRGEILPCGRFKSEVLKRFGLYYNRPALELIFLPKSEHLKLHSKDYQRENNPHFGHSHTEETKDILRKKRLGMKLSKEWCDNIGKSKKGQTAWNKGKRLSKDYKAKISKTITGRHWYNDGNIEFQAKECPDGFIKGRLKRKKLGD